jgi:hypothetical protein
MTAKISFGPDFWDPAGLDDKTFQDGFQCF